MITRVADSPVFRRSGDNLEVEVPLTIPEAIQGAVIEVPTLSGSGTAAPPEAAVSRDVGLALLLMLAGLLILAELALMLAGGLLVSGALVVP